MPACRALHRRLDRLVNRMKPAVSIVCVLFRSEGNLSSIAMSDGTRLEGDQARQALQNAKPDRPFKIYCGFDPDAAIRRNPSEAV